VVPDVGRSDWVVPVYEAILRAASRCEPVYEAIRQTVGRSDWVVPDETGWRVGGCPAWLHALVGREATAYVIDPTRSGAVAEAILGLDYDGTMIHDGWSPYDRFEDARHQRCRGRPGLARPSGPAWTCATVTRRAGSAHTAWQWRAAAWRAS
jgi:hypothetical protein